MRRTLSFAGSLVAAFTVMTLPAGLRDARACGGCFHGPPQPTEQESVITDHRMAFSISTTQTILWDQVRYSGNPGEFAWVLPVHPGARIELAQDAFLATLASISAPTVTPPPASCGGPVSQSSGGFGCGATSDSASPTSLEGPRYTGNGNVDVITQQVVGPYESVTLRSSNGDALDAWLVANGFDVPSAIAPTIAAYASEKFDFIALKLRPDQGVGAMQPVRVVSPGADASMPLRMVAAGIGANVGLELYVIGEGRYHTQSFPDATIDFSKLTWDPAASRSNYSTLAAAALAAGDGTGWLTEYAGHPAVEAYYGAGSLSSLYLASCGNKPPAWVGCDASAPLATDASDDAAGDAATTAADAGECLPRYVSPCDDVDVALQGMHPADVWVTRLRALLPAHALSAGDLRLAATSDQSAIANQHTAVKYTDPSYSPCGANGAASPGGSGCTCETVPDARDRFGLGCLMGALVLGAGVYARRRAR